LFSESLTGLAKRLLTCPVFKVHTRQRTPLGFVGESDYTTSQARLSRASPLCTRFSGISRFSRAPSPLLEAGYMIPCPKQVCQGFKPDSGQIQGECGPNRGICGFTSSA